MFPRGHLKRFASEFAVFALKNVWSCIFAGSFFLLLLVSKHCSLLGLPRYDFLFLASVALQFVLVGLGFESPREVRVILLFHAIGMGLELFKTSPAIGSWSYPEFGYLKVLTVPLYSGFMYSAVGSYISQAFKVFSLRLVHHPPYALSVALCALIYLNFFTEHFIGDYRWWLIGAVVLSFLRTTVYFTVLRRERKMPLLLAFFLIGFFIWIAENISTWLGAWQYPEQAHAWAMVSGSKITSWFLLVIISFIVVAGLHHFRRWGDKEEQPSKLLRWGSSVLARLSDENDQNRQFPMEKASVASCVK